MTRRVLAADLLLPGGGQEAVPDGAVLVDGGTIADAGPRAAVLGRAPAGTPVVELGAATLLPGLIDCHVHLVFDASENPLGAFLAADDAALLPAMAGRAARLLDAGVTTARDLGDRGGLVRGVRDAVDAGEIPGPRLLSAGTPLTITGGHCWFLGGEADGVDAVRAAVRRNLRDGADLTKIMATGGTMTTTGPRPHQVQFTDAEIAAAVEESARFGRRVAAHVHGTDGIAAALAAGVDTLEHCTFASAVPRRPDLDYELVDRMAADGVFVCPTFSSTLDTVVTERGADAVKPYLELVRREYEAGVRLVAGTDAGVHLAAFEAYAEGLLWYERAGLPVDAVLEMATSQAAAALGLSDETGRIAPGLAADLLAVPGDVREDLRALRRPLLVLARGRLHVPRGAAERAALGGAGLPAAEAAV